MIAIAFRRSMGPHSPVLSGELHPRERAASQQFVVREHRLDDAAQRIGRAPLLRYATVTDRGKR